MGAREHLLTRRQLFCVREVVKHHTIKRAARAAGADPATFRRVFNRALGMPSAEKESGPVGSTEEARELQALPRSPPNHAAIQEALRTWPALRRDLLYAHVRDVVARFGFPQNATLRDKYLMWEYDAGQTLKGAPDRLVFKIARNHVVDVLVV